MFQKQKDSILKLLKSNRAEKNFRNNYLFPYKDFIDTTDYFTSFACEELDGKQAYLSLIESLRNADEAARIFVQVYGYEELDNDQFIYADTLILFSRLSLSEIKQIFNEPKDIFPSDIGELTDFNEPFFIIDKEGALSSETIASISDNGQFGYYCWWD